MSDAQAPAAQQGEVLYLATVDGEPDWRVRSEDVAGVGRVDICEWWDGETWQCEHDDGAAVAGNCAHLARLLRAAEQRAATLEAELATSREAFASDLCIAQDARIEAEQRAREAGARAERLLTALREWRWATASGREEADGRLCDAHNAEDPALQDALPAAGELERAWDAIDGMGPLTEYEKGFADGQATARAAMETDDDDEALERERDELVSVVRASIPSLRAIARHLHLLSATERANGSGAADDLLIYAGEIDEINALLAGAAGDKEGD